MRLGLELGLLACERHASRGSDAPACRGRGRVRVMVRARVRVRVRVRVRDRDRATV